MENNERDRKLDQWLDEALSKYSAAEPRFGLEQRVLSQIRGAEKTRSRWNIWKWMPAFAAIAAVLIVGVAILPMTRNKKYEVTDSLAKKQAAQTPTVDRDKLAVATELEDGQPQKNEMVVRNGAPKIVDRRRNEESRANAMVYSDSAGKVKDQAKLSVSSSNGNLVVSGMPQAVPPPPPPAVSSPVPQTIFGGAMNQSSPAATRADAAASRTSTENDSLGQVGPAKETNDGEIPVRSSKNAFALDDSKDASQNAVSESIPVEKVTVAKETQALKRMKKERQAKERAAQEKAGDAAFAGAFGTVVRTDLKQVPAGPMAFPSPTPLSEQEKLVLAAAKKMKDAPKQETQGGSIPPVEIKDVQIAPIEAPKK